MADIETRRMSSASSPEIPPEPRTDDKMSDAEVKSNIELNSLKPDEFEDSGFGENDNPIFILESLRQKIENQKDTVFDGTILDIYNNGHLNLMAQGVIRSQTLLKSCCCYLMEFVNELDLFREVLQEVTASMKDKLLEEFKPYSTQDIPKSRDEIQALERATQAQAEVSRVARDLSETVHLSAEVEETACKVAAEAARITAQSEQMDQYIDAAEEQGKAERRSQQDLSEENEEEIQQETEENGQEEEVNVSDEETVKKEEEEQTQIGLELEKKRRQEEDRKKREEMERKRIEGEKLKQQKEEERRRHEEESDPKNWPVFAYSHGDDYYDEDEMDENANGDIRQREVTCYVRAQPGELEKEQLECDWADQVESSLRLRENEELVSDIIKVSSKSGPLNFQHPIWLAVPHSAPRGQHAKEVVILKTTDDVTWREVKTRDILLQSHRDHARVAECPLRYFDQATFAVIMRIKEEHERTNNKGGKIASSVDPRVCVVVPRNAFRFSTELMLKIQPVDLSTIHDLKRRYHCDTLVATSHMVFLHQGALSLKPLTIWMSNPGQGSKRPKTGLANKKERQAASILPARPTTAAGSHHREHEPQSGPVGNLYMVTRSEQGSWTLHEEFTFKQQRDLLSFKAENNMERFILLRVRGEPAAEDLEYIAESVERCLSERLVSCIVRQKSEDMTQCCLELCAADSADTVLDALREQGYDEGPDPSEPICIKEGQKMKVKFRGNIDFEEGEFLKFVYNSHRHSARRCFLVKELDRFSQHGLPYFRGHVQVWTLQPQDKDKKIQPTEDVPTDQAKTNLLLLHETPVILPKPAYQHVSVRKAPVQFKEEGPIDQEFLDILCHALGDEWRFLAENLGVNKARVQSIIRDNMENGSLEKCIRDVFICWYKNAPISSDKVGELFWALKDIGREDLGQELLERNQEYQQETDKKQEEEKMKKAFKIIMDSSAILLNWQGFVRGLGVSDEDIEIINYKDKDTMRERFLEALQTWQKTKGDRASRKVLLRYLRKLKHNDAAERIKLLG